jgi:hypothetical protein
MVKSIVITVNLNGERTMKDIDDKAKNTWEEAKNKAKDMKEDVKAEYHKEQGRQEERQNQSEDTSDWV